MTKLKLKKPNVAVFCGSRSGIKSIYKSKTRELSRLLAKNSFPIIYGGGKTGLMGALSETYIKKNGKITGIIPNFLNIPSLVQVGLSKFYKVNNLRIRKNLMINKSDIFIILPGGIGTLDEFFEIAAINQLCLSNKPIIFYNINGFWSPLKNLFLFLKNEGFIKNKDLNEFIWAKNSDEIIKIIKKVYNY